MAFSYIFIAHTSVTGSEYECLLFSYLFPCDPLPFLWRMTVGCVRDSNQGKGRGGISALAKRSEVASEEVGSQDRFWELSGGPCAQ